MKLVRGTVAFNGVGVALSCAFAADGTLWVLRRGDPNTLTAYDPAGNTLEVRDVGAATAFVTDPIEAAEASAMVRGPDGTLALVFDDGSLRIGSLTAKAHDKSAWCVDWDGDRIATGGWDNRAKLWAPDGTLLAEIKTNNVRAVCLQGETLTTGGGSGRVHRWSTSGESLGPPLPHSFPHGGDAGVQSVAVRDGVVYTWANDKAVRAFRDGAPLWRTELDDHMKGTRALALGPNTLAVAGTSGPVAILDLQGQRLNERGLDQGLATLDPTPRLRTEQGHLEVHDGGFVRRIAGAHMRAGSFGPDESWLVSLGQCALSWWWLDPLQIEAQRVKVPYFVHNVAVSASGGLVATAHEDGVLVHRTVDGGLEAECSIAHAGGVVFAGPRALYVNSRGGLYRWNLVDAPVRAAGCDRKAERYIERDAGWPIRLVGSTVEFLGGDLNVWAVDVDPSETSEASAHPPHRPAAIDWSQTVWFLTGTFGHVDRAVAAAWATARGGAVAKSLTKKVTHVVVGLGTSAYGQRAISTQEAAAAAAGLPVLTEADFIALCTPSAEAVRSWSPEALTAWRTARPKQGMHRPLEIPALRGIAWPGANLAGANLSHADLRGANLDGADLSRIAGERLDLRGASLRGAKLDGAKLYMAELAGCDLTGASTVGTDWYGTRLQGVIGLEAAP